MQVFIFEKVSPSKNPEFKHSSDALALLTQHGCELFLSPAFESLVLPFNNDKDIPKKALASLLFSIRATDGNQYIFELDEITGVLDGNNASRIILNKNLLIEVAEPIFDALYFLKGFDKKPLLSYLRAKHLPGYREAYELEIKKLAPDLIEQLADNVAKKNAAISLASYEEAKKFRDIQYKLLEELAPFKQQAEAMLADRYGLSPATPAQS